MIKSSIYNRYNIFYIKGVKDLPYSVHELAQHLESFFESGMTWENNGSCGLGAKYNRNPKGWCLGHIKPRQSFPDTKEGELKFMSLDNIRPEWTWFNQMKGIMTPEEMKKWITENNILSLIPTLIEKQINKE